jgi:hypothetical protein
VGNRIEVTTVCVNSLIVYEGTMSQDYKTGALLLHDLVSELLPAKVIPKCQFT